MHVIVNGSRAREGAVDKLLVVKIRTADLISLQRWIDRCVDSRPSAQDVIVEGDHCPPALCQLCRELDRIVSRRPQYPARHHRQSCMAIC